jgi:hypothetical protein
MSWYSCGVATGYSWEFCVGGGYRLGQLDQSGQLTGPEVSYLYPDLRTGLTGRSRLSQLDQSGQLTGPEVSYLYPDLRTGLTGR